MNIGSVTKTVIAPTDSKGKARAKPPKSTKKWTAKKKVRNRQKEQRRDLKSAKALSSGFAQSMEGLTEEDTAAMIAKREKLKGRSIAEVNSDWLANSA